MPGGRARDVGLVRNFLAAPADLCEPVNKDLQNDDVEEVEATWWRTMRLELVCLLLFAFVFWFLIHVKEHSWLWQW